MTTKELAQLVVQADSAEDLEPLAAPQGHLPDRQTPVKLAPARADRPYVKRLISNGWSRSDVINRLVERGNTREEAIALWDAACDDWREMAELRAASRPVMVEAHLYRLHRLSQMAQRAARHQAPGAWGAVAAFEKQIAAVSGFLEPVKVELSGQVAHAHVHATAADAQKLIAGASLEDLEALERIAGRLAAPRDEPAVVEAELVGAPLVSE